MNLKQVEVKENETAVDNLFIFTIMEINEEIDDAQSESELRGKLKINLWRCEIVHLNIRDKNQEGFPLNAIKRIAISRRHGNFMYLHGCK